MTAIRTCAENAKTSVSSNPCEIQARMIDSKGQSIRITALRDITERKQAEQILKDEMVRRCILVDQSRDGIVVLDQEGKVYEANQRFTGIIDSFSFSCL